MKIKSKYFYKSLIYRKIIFIQFGIEGFAWYLSDRYIIHV